MPSAIELWNLQYVQTRKYIQGFDKREMFLINESISWWLGAVNGFLICLSCLISLENCEKVVSHLFIFLS